MFTIFVYRKKQTRSFTYKNNKTMVTSTLYIDKKNMVKSLVKVFGSGANKTRTEKTTTFKKAAGIYGLENEINHILKHTKADKIIFCELD